MGSVPGSIIVTGLFIIATAVVGKFISDAGKPYKKGKLAVHLVLFLFCAAGAASNAMKLAGDGKTNPAYAFYLVCFAMLLILASGARMVMQESVDKKAVIIHRALVFIIIGSVVASAFL